MNNTNGKPSLLILAIAAVGTVVEAQFWEKMSNPRIAINLTHPPKLGLQLKKLAIAQPSGECAEEIADGLGSLLAGKGIEVVDRQNLQAVLAEHRFSTSGYVDADSAAQLGKMLGPSALVFVKVTRCRSEKRVTHEDRRTSQRIIRRHFATTEFHVRGTFQTVDLTTSRIFAASPLNVDWKRVNHSDEGVPEYPSEDIVRDEAMQMAVRGAASYLVPWGETRSVYFYDDKECGLNLAYASLKANDIARTVQKSEENLANCKVASNRKNNTLAHAYYNAGLSQLLIHEHAKAMAYLEESEKLRGGDIVTQTIAEAQRSAQLALAAQRVEQKTAQFEQAAAATKARDSAPTVMEKKPADPAKTAEPIEDRLRKLDALFKKGLITKDEFEQKKTALLREL